MIVTSMRRLIVLVLLLGLSGCPSGAGRIDTPIDSGTVVERDAFACESLARQEKFVGTAAGMGIARENAEKLYVLSGAGFTDVVTGFAPAQDREPTVERAIRRVAEIPMDSAYYVEVDIQNLGGLNQELGHTGANAVYHHMAQTAEQYIQALDADTCSFRHGGDEFSFLVIGPEVSQSDVEKALADADAQIRTYIADEGLANIEHPKHKGVASKAGAGIIFGVSQIDGKAGIEDVFRNADKIVEAKKQE
jgi:GGDEF domain-containing protein